MHSRIFHCKNAFTVPIFLLNKVFNSLKMIKNIILNLRIFQADLQSVTKLLSHLQICSFFCHIPPMWQYHKKLPSHTYHLDQILFSKTLTCGKGGTKISFFQGWLNNVVSDCGHKSLRRRWLLVMSRQAIHQRIGSHLKKP